MVYNANDMKVCFKDQKKYVETSWALIVDLAIMCVVRVLTIRIFFVSHKHHIVTEADVNMKIGDSTQEFCSPCFQN